MINWKRKLTSRKFWAAVIGFATAIVTVFKIDCISAEQVQLLLGAMATLVAYIFGEGLSDVAAVKANNNSEADNSHKSSDGK